ncbi:MAG: hypothetical protein NXH71_00455 [Erythrobacteraceae bacterium]|jgi:hypothetical protein|nr:hypothetical protein [Erythrobacteraceae bacterium]
MDTLRGPFDSGEPADTAGLASDRGWDATEDDSPQSASHHDLPPETIGQDERRMQVRAYNHWAGLQGERMFPPIDDLDPANLPDFGPYGVLLDFTSGIENPAVQFLGDRLAQECGGHGAITRLSDVPPRSLLSRITDHYMQILANQAPIGFEAEFVNQRGAEILYRGILLPFSSNDETIDFIYGVINWKEMADQLMADELLLEIDQALELDEALEVADEPQRRAADPVTDWADSPAHEADDGGPDDQGADDQEASYQGLGVDPDAVSAEPQVADSDLPLPDFGQYALDDVEDEDYDEDEGEEDNAGYSFASLADYVEAPSKKAIDPASLPYDPDAPSDFDAPYAVDHAESFDAASHDEPAMLADHLPEGAGLYDWLAAARELAHTADVTEDRSRSALYLAVSRAYDFSLAAREAPEDYAELIAESGLAVQDRAPMTPVVKLVFGHDYDKTRLTEYAAVLNHAHRIGLERGSLSRFLGEAEGGLKGVVKAERRLRREEQGKAIAEKHGLRAALAKKLRALEALSLEALAGEGPEFALVMVRRDAAGNVAVLGELPEDVPQLERAAKKLVG